MNVPAILANLAVAVAEQQGEILALRQQLAEAQQEIAALKATGPDA